MSCDFNVFSAPTNSVFPSPISSEVQRYIIISRSPLGRKHGSENNGLTTPPPLCTSRAACFFLGMRVCLSACVCAAEQTSVVAVQYATPIKNLLFYLGQARIVHVDILDGNVKTIWYSTSMLKRSLCICPSRSGKKKRQGVSVLLLTSSVQKSGQGTFLIFLRPETRA